MKTTTQMLREFKLTTISESTLNNLEYCETEHLRLAYFAGKRNDLTFEQWHNTSFNQETK